METTPARPAGRNPGGRKALPLEQRRLEFIKVWVTSSEKQIAMGNAAACNLEMSAFAREVLLKKNVVIKSAPPAEFYEAYASLARVGGNLNQLCHALNAAASIGMIEDATMARLSQIETTIKSVSESLSAVREILISK
ncbi:MAG: hypothetical protein H3C29_08240 [Simplicispira suum]|uniref:plasmid mobilization protein n=1 Tax=Simplicispira suum TaxID=2109915 RepID=UPI001C6BE76E|nr:hypothetical protein [Simplicispira suum]MBW7833192.1 hypothetical protein [Simplicispira suum]